MKEVQSQSCRAVVCCKGTSEDDEVFEVGRRLEESTDRQPPSARGMTANRKRR